MTRAYSSVQPASHALLAAALVAASLPVSAQDATQPVQEAADTTVVAAAQAAATQSAQPDDIDDDHQAARLATVFVSADRLNRPLSESTASVGVVGRAAIEASSDARMSDIVAQFANVVSTNSDREVAIRGVPLNGIGGEGETISVYLDGLALPARAASFGGPLSAWDMEQVEVLRGAQSTQQGRNSLAGTINLRARESTADWDARVRAAGSNPYGYDFAVAGGGPLGESLRFRIAAQDRYDRGDINNVTRNEDDAGRSASKNLRAKLAFVPESWSDYRALLSFTYANNDFGDNLHDSTLKERTETSDERYDERYRSRVIGLEQSLRVGEHALLESVTGAVLGRDFRNADYDRTEKKGGVSTFQLDDNLYSQELRLSSQGEGWRGVVGAYYSQGKTLDRSTGREVPTAGGAALLSGDVTAHLRSYTGALFGEGDYDVGDHLRFTAGLRYNRERLERDAMSDLTFTLTAPIPGLPAPINVPLPDAISDQLAMLLPDSVPPDYSVQGRRNFVELLPKLGVTWRFDEMRSLALTYAEGYRSGGTSVSFFGGAVSDFNPEKTRTLELAGRSEWFNQRLAVNANLFYTRWYDQQVTIGDPTSFYTTTTNAGRSHLYGLETEVTWALPYKLELFGSLGLIRTEFDEFTNQGISYAGNQFPYAPRMSGTVGLTLKQWQRFSGQIAVTHLGDTFSDPNNSPGYRVPARTLLNAKASARLGYGVLLSIYGRNLLDDLNLQTQFAAKDRIAKKYGEPRTVGLMLEWSL